jgi:transcriptional regulator with XRE-family HTH domain
LGCLDFIHYIGYLSTIVDISEDSIDRRVAAQVRRLRSQRRLSLNTLAKRSGVSRSMISLIERGEASPTAVLLERLATGLGIALAQLFDAPVEALHPSPSVARRSRQPVWRDPASGYVRRNVSPAQTADSFRIVEVEFPAGGHVAFETTVHEPPLHQQVWVLAGSIQLTVGEQTHRLERGDCLAMKLDQLVVFANPGAKPARYAVVISGTSAVAASPR